MTVWTCALCSLADSSLLCARCAAGLSLPARIRLVNARIDYASVAGAARAHAPDHSSTKITTADACRAQLGRARVALASAKSDLQGLQASACELRDQVRHRAHDLHRARRALANAHDLQHDAVGKSSGRAVTRLAHARAQVRAERCRLVADVAAAFAVTRQQDAAEQVVSVNGMRCVNLASMSELPHQVLATSLERTAVVCFVAAQALSVVLPFEISLHQQHQQHQQQQTNRHCVINNTQAAVGIRHRSGTGFTRLSMPSSAADVDAFFEAVAMLTCNLLFLVPADQASSLSAVPDLGQLLWAVLHRPRDEDYEIVRRIADADADADFARVLGLIRHCNSEGRDGGHDGDDQARALHDWHMVDHVDHAETWTDVRRRRSSKQTGPATSATTTN
ncbi:UV radiation resistance protein and autophagy-related subunit 14-domain-containing protein [Lipomyces japonicus]|uniref:UV radiation resistance protein and autophagy-related subunit 14-domain-containing protein n=1 Tax=Lipomyces japonicus TaxID=56871 RepID=UPI0034CE5D9D